MSLKIKVVNNFCKSLSFLSYIEVIFNLSFSVVKKGKRCFQATPVQYLKNDLSDKKKNIDK